jgi:hypothetical protein
MIKVIFTESQCPHGGIDEAGHCGYVAVKTHASPDLETAVERKLRENGGVGTKDICQCCNQLGTIRKIEQS